MQKTISVNDHLTLACPDGFHVMDEAERKNLTFIAEGPCECITDPVRHILITVGCRTLGKLAAMLVSAKDAAGNMEAALREAMRRYSFRENGSAAIDLSGEKARGLSYGYVAHDTDMYAESYVAKRGKALYYLNFYVRETYRDRGLKTWEEFLSSAEWK